LISSHLIIYHLIYHHLTIYHLTISFVDTSSHISHSSSSLQPEITPRHFNTVFVDSKVREMVDEMVDEMMMVDDGK